MTVRAQRFEIVRRVVLAVPIDVVNVKLAGMTGLEATPLAPIGK
jgi:hypothetical protein